MTAQPTLIWRSGLFVPVNVERFLAKASSRGADVIQLDLEDSIAPADKAEARRAVGPAVTRLLAEGRSDVFIRINQPLELAIRDLEAAVLPGVAGITVTKAEGPDHIRLLDELVTRLEQRRGIAAGTLRFVILIEAPGPLQRAHAIAAASPRNFALSLGSEDYATAVGGEPGPELLHFPKMQILQAARAHGLQPFGTLGGVAGFADTEGQVQAVRRAATLGFTGSSAIHPAQIPALNAGFTPSAEAVARAGTIVALDAEAAAAHRGAWAFEGKMIDIPIVERAQALLARAHAIAQREARHQAAR
ncbi:CoA ester lyase [Roseomonas sp. 18066]|uniref:HpcH/HpaI aldolase/citrate lyase family protein n=1 Tax=Roseomonas sp. 18066 TaxID=2681412 RepID=UPI00135CCA2F|nr:CoA ester lyase [Roseomonas sp. 18066]